MNRILAVFGMAAVMCTPGVAQAQNWYFSGFGAMNYNHDGDANGGGEVEYDLGFGVGGSIGYAMPNGLRLEGEVAYRRNDIDTVGGIPNGGELGTWAFMGNAVYEFNVQSSVKPHIGGGLGVVHGTVDYGGVSFDDTELGAQFIAGVDYNVAPDLALIFDYRYLVTSDFGFGAGAGLAGLEYSTSMISVGLRKRF